MGSLLTNEFEEVLALLQLQCLRILEDDELELNNCFEFGHVSPAHIQIRLVHKLLAILPAVQIDFIGVGPLLDSIAKVGAFVIGAFKLHLHLLELLHLRPAEHALVLPDVHVVAEIVSAAPPLLISHILRSVVKLQHLYEVLLGVEPGLLDHQSINMVLQLLVLDVVGVHEVETNNDHDALDGASQSHS